MSQTPVDPIIAKIQALIAEMQLKVTNLDTQIKNNPDQATLLIQQVNAYETTISTLKNEIAMMQKIQPQPSSRRKKAA